MTSNTTPFTTLGRTISQPRFETEDRLQILQRSIRGPRRQVWRGTGLYDELAEARRLADRGRIEEAIKEATNAWIRANEHAHDVDFRVVTKTTTVSFIGAWEMANQDYTKGD